MKPILTSLLLLLFSSSLFATAQYPDKIIYNGKEYSLHSNPMEAYFAEHPDKRPEDGIRSTACWRGYIATFEIRDKQLFLKDIQCQYSKKGKNNSFETEWKSVLGEIFPKDSLVKIDWLTGLLVLPYGKMVNYVHMGYASTYENYFLLEIDKGDFKKEKKLDYKEYEAFRDKQFAAWQKTDEYKKQLEELTKDGSSVEFINSFLRDYVIEYTSRILTDD
ncbi:MAG: hypothetical protein V2A54_16655 [Bacteroidota bacterium]